MNRRLDRGLQALNLTLIGLVLIGVVHGWATDRRVVPLVDADPKTNTRIHQLEQLLLSEPANMDHALELAQLYQDVSEFPWSYHTLLTAEKQWSPDPGWRMALGLAYLNLGKNKDCLRVLSAAKNTCQDGIECSSNLRTKLDIFIRLTELFLQRGIDARSHAAAAGETLREILKPVEANPDKMRPKAPEEPKSPTQEKPRS